MGFIPADVLATLGALTGLLLVGLVTYGIKWSHAKAAEMDAKTAQWEAMTRQAVESAQKAAKTGQVTQDMLRENTEMTQQAAVNTNGVLRDLRAAAVRALEFRRQISEQLSESPPSQLKDDLDDMMEKYSDIEKKMTGRK